MLPATNRDVPRAPSRSSSMKPPPPRFPLMTPSASPPVQRPLGRNYDGPSPIKRQRMTSEAPAIMRSGSCSSTRSRSLGPTSFSLPSPALSIEHAVDQVEDLHAARRASSFKVLHVWSQLAEKYAKPLDEDDIVDLESETIIKDYGVLRSSNNTWDIGCFADDHENERQQIASEDEPDELDAFAETASRSETDGEEDDLELARQQLRLPPVRELDPADAADLAEFMEAERRRKELFGDIDEESDRRSTTSRSEVEYEEEEGVDGGFETQGEETHVEDEDDANQGAWEDSDDEGEYVEVYEDCQLSLRGEEDGKRFRAEAMERSESILSGSPEIDFIDLSTADSDEGEDGNIQDYAAAEDDKEELDYSSEAAENLVEEEAESDDELGGWDQDEGTVVYELADPEIVEIEDGDEDLAVEIDRQAATSTGKSDSKRGTSTKQTTKRRPAASRNPPQETKTQRKTTKKASSASPAAALKPVQLNTPPRSSSFGPKPHAARVATSNSRRRKKSSSPKRTTQSALTPPSKAVPFMRDDSQDDSELPSKLEKTSISNAVSPARKPRPSSNVFIDLPSLKLEMAPNLPKSTPKTHRRSSRRNQYSDEVSDGSAAVLSSNKLTRKGKEKAVDLPKVGPARKALQASPSTMVRHPLANSPSNTPKDVRRYDSVDSYSSTRKRRRESTPPYVVEVEEYYTTDALRKDEEHQRSLSVSISPSPPPFRSSVRDRAGTSSSNLYPHDNESRYGTFDYFYRGPRCPQSCFRQLIKKLALAHGIDKPLNSLTHNLSVVIALIDQILPPHPFNGVALILVLIHITSQALLMTVKHRVQKAGGTNKVLQMYINNHLRYRQLVCRPQRLSSTWLKLRRTYRTSQHYWEAR